MSYSTIQLSPSWVAVYDRHKRCLGHVLDRGRRGFEAFDVDDRSLGRFDDLQSAADAVSNLSMNNTNCHNRFTR